MKTTYRNYIIQPSTCDWNPYKWEYYHEEYQAEVIDGDWISDGLEGEGNTLEECMRAIDEDCEQAATDANAYLQEKARDKYREALVAYEEARGGR